MPSARAVVALATVATVAAAGGAQAKTFEVTRTNDPNPGNCRPNDCSLREAVQAANARPGADRIQLPSSKRPYKLTIPGDTSDDSRDGDLDVANDALQIVHPGKGRATIRGVQLGDRLFDVFDGAPLRLAKLELTGGAVPPANGSGGAIRAAARLVVSRSSVVGNSTEETGGAIDATAAVTLVRSVVARNDALDQGGALNTVDGPLRIVRSVLRGNDTGNTGGAIRNNDGALTILHSRLVGNEAAGQGGALRNAGDGPVRIEHSTVSGNRTGAYGGGIELSEGPALIRDTTVSGNRAVEHGGGIAADGTQLTVVNSTIAGNTADTLGGGMHADDSAQVSLNAVTIARNTAAADDPGPVPSSGGGIYQIDAVFAVRNTLIALNRIGEGGIQANDCEGETFISQGNNLLSTRDECDGFTVPTDLERANPKIAKLRRNGGPTETVALKRGSAAIGNAYKPSAPKRDQRGRKRDNQPDIGAFERGA